MRWKKKDRERYITERLCAHLRDGWEISRMQEEPDAIIAGPEFNVGVELCEIQYAGAENDAFNNARDLLQGIIPSWIDDSSVNHWGVTIGWRLTKPLIPIPSERDRFLDELKYLVRAHEKQHGQVNAQIKWMEDFPRLRNGNSRTHTLKLQATAFPLLHQYVVSLRISHYGDAVVGLHNDSLATGGVGIHRDELQRLVGKKLKRLPTYRDNAPDIPIWLILYNGGQGITRSIVPKTHLPIASTLLHEIEAGFNDRFDRVLWGVDVLMEGAGTGRFYDLHHLPNSYPPLVVREDSDT